MTAYFEIAVKFVAMGSRGALYDSQREFPAERGKCGTNKTCILVTYKKQMVPLEGVIQLVSTKGPY